MFALPTTTLTSSEGGPEGPAARLDKDTFSFSIQRALLYVPLAFWALSTCSDVASFTSALVLQRPGTYTSAPRILSLGTCWTELHRGRCQRQLSGALRPRHMRYPCRPHGIQDSIYKGTWSCPSRRVHRLDEDQHPGWWFWKWPCTLFLLPAYLFTLDLSWRSIFRTESCLTANLFDVLGACFKQDIERNGASTSRPFLFPPYWPLSPAIPRAPWVSLQPHRPAYNLKALVQSHPYSASTLGAPWLATQRGFVESRTTQCTLTVHGLWHCGAYVVYNINIQR